MNPPLPANAAEIAVHFEHLLESEGARAALVYLNGLTDFRFSGVFRFEEAIHSVYYYDRENPDQTAVADIPLEASYCSYVRLRNGAFTTADAMLDPSLRTHAARESVRSYCGVPVFSPEKDFLGTLCHFDTEPRDAKLINQDLMQDMAGRLGRAGHLPI